MGRNPKLKFNPENLRAPKGTRDIFGEEYEYQKEIFEKAEKIAAYYGFFPLQTPHIEKEELFNATLGETTDIIEKQMYTIRTRGGDKLVLRPEGTAPAMRAYFEHGMQALPQPIMLYYKGQFFRHENPQKGRFREFSGFGLEILGTDDPVADGMIIRLMSLILKEIGLKSFIVHINSIGDKECAPIYKKELVSFLKRKINYLCKDCKRRVKLNPLRVLDCKEEKCREIIEEAPQMINYLCEECQKHFKNTLEYLETLEIPYYIDNFLVRGLDYYTRTVFEFFEERIPEKKETGDAEKENIPFKIALGGGGRFDYLGSLIGNRNVPAVGGGLGVDRLAMILKELKEKEESKEKTEKTKAVSVYLIQLGDLAKRKSLILLEELRKANIPARHALSKDNLRSQLKSAANINVRISLIIGQKEALDNSVIARDMETGSQKIIPLEGIVNYLKTIQNLKN